MQFGWELFAQLKALKVCNIADRRQATAMRTKLRLRRSTHLSAGGRGCHEDRGGARRRQGGEWGGFSGGGRHLLTWLGCGGSCCQKGVKWLSRAGRRGKLK